MHTVTERRTKNERADTFIMPSRFTETLNIFSHALTHCQPHGSALWPF